MSPTPKLLTVAIGLAAVVTSQISATPAAAKYRHYYGSYRHLHAGYGYGAPVYPGATPGYSPYNERYIIRQPNGTYIGTDPDANIRTYMRHDNIGPNGVPSGPSR